jgi:hypothetical protein
MQGSQVARDYARAEELLTKAVAAGVPESESVLLRCRDVMAHGGVAPEVTADAAKPKSGN